MYGLINKAVRALIVSQYGEATWNEIVKRAGCQALFISYTSYPDETTYALVGAASDVLGVPAQDLLELVGRYWISYTRQHGYKSLFDIGGSSLVEFLCNLNAMHTHIQAQFPKLRMPTFWCTDIGPHSLTLHYRPGRPSRNGLAPLVVGLMKGLADLFHLEDFEIEHTGKRSNDGAQLDDDDVAVDFDVFQLRWESDPSTGSSIEPPSMAMFESTSADTYTTASMGSLPPLEDDAGYGGGSGINVDKIEAFEARWQFSLPPARFASAFPFHLVLSQDLKIVQAGDVIQRLCPEMTLNSDFFQHWRIVRPEIMRPHDLKASGGGGSFISVDNSKGKNESGAKERSKGKNSGMRSFQAIKDNRDVLFLIEYRHNRRLKLRGQMNVIASSEGCHVTATSSTGTGRKRERHRARSRSKPDPVTAPLPSRSPRAASPRCPMMATSTPLSPGRSAYNPVISASTSAVPSTATSSLPPVCPMSSSSAAAAAAVALASSMASSTSAVRRKKNRSNSESAKGDALGAPVAKERRPDLRPEENDTSDIDALTDSSRTVIITNISSSASEEQQSDVDIKDPEQKGTKDATHKPAKEKKTKPKSKKKTTTTTGGAKVEEFVFFLGSVQVKDNEEVVGLGLSLHDFALHDSVKEVLLLAASNQTTMKDVHQMEEFILYGMEGGGAGGGGGKQADDSPDATGGSNTRRHSRHQNHHPNKNSKCILS